MLISEKDDRGYDAMTEKKALDGSRALNVFVLNLTVTKLVIQRVQIYTS
jgi:hypothetical protein